MNELLAMKRVSTFPELLAAYQKAGVVFENAIDGGAGSGSTAKQMLPYVSGRVFAFEPFPGNHRFFEGLDSRIVLIPKALAHEDRMMDFHVHSVVPEDSTWGERGMVGYSSVGKLVAAPADSGIEVPAVRADEEILSPIDFVKLDLQGGEFNALRGMKNLLQNTALMWIEDAGHEGVYDFVTEQGFMVFDTEYFFIGEPSEEAKAEFDVSKENVQLSTGKVAWFGFKKRPWRDYCIEFADYRMKYGLVQTDLVCVNRLFIDDFLRAAQYL